MARASVGPWAVGARRIDAFEAAEDPLFSGLDGRTIHGGAQPWIVRVTGIHRLSAGVFVQVSSPDDDPASAVVIRMAPHATAAHALAALEARSALPECERRHVVDVMKLADSNAC
jgi:hypothetical protein